jgi:hypothetical protein
LVLSVLSYQIPGFALPKQLDDAIYETNRTGRGRFRILASSSGEAGENADDTFRNRKFVDSLLEGDGFELSVPRQIGNSFRASSEIGPIDRRRGGGEQLPALATDRM